MHLVAMFSVCACSNNIRYAFGNLGVQRCTVRDT